MIKLILFTFLTIFTNTHTINTDNPEKTIQKSSDRISELDAYWNELSRTVKEGDFDGYAKAYHEDAVVIFAMGKNKTSMAISGALAGWKQGFVDTKSGKVKSDVKFRFSQRLGNDNTAHETGIFHYTSSGGENDVDILVHFEMLFVKKDGKWLGVMEYQKSFATKDEWNALK